MTYKKFVFASDNHGRLVSAEAQQKLMDFCKVWKPDYKVHGGDVWDFQPLRRNCDQSERADGIDEDFQMGMEFLDAFQPQYLTLGNHCDRIYQHAKHASDGILRECCQGLVKLLEAELKKRKIKWVPYHVSKYLRLPEGGPKFVHGFRATMYPARALAESYGAAICGHVHKPDLYHSRTVESQIAMTAGCMADIEKMTYADRYQAKLSWKNGWIYGYVAKGGRWQAWHVTKEDGVWISPMGIL